MVYVTHEGNRRLYRGDNLGWTPVWIVDERMKDNLYFVVYRGTDKREAVKYLYREENKNEKNV